LPRWCVTLNGVNYLDYAQARPQEAFLSIAQDILRIRPQAWPNLRIIEFGDAALHCDGALVAAATQVYREQLSRRPELAKQMIDGGRGRKVTPAQKIGALTGRNES
jgi:hypothetical protein